MPRSRCCLGCGRSACAGVPAARAWQPPERARPASRTDERRRWWLPGDALIKLEGGGGRERRIGKRIVLGVGGRPQRRAAGGCAAGWCRRPTDMGEDGAHGGAIGEEGDDADFDSAGRPGSISMGSPRRAMHATAKGGA